MKRTVVVLIVCLGWPASVLAGTAFVDPIYGFSKLTSIFYGTGAINNGAGTLNLLLDLYRPTNIGGGAVPVLSPGIVLIHGGGFAGGDKNDFASLAQTFATYGYTVASINYRLSGHNVPPTPGPADFLTPAPPGYFTLPGASTINAAINDSKAAMAWMRFNAGLYKIDANHIAIGGASAGGITSLLEAYNNPPANAAPQAVLDYVGSMYGTEGTIHAGAPPAFVVHGTADTLVPFSDAQAVVNRMNAVGVYNEFYVSGLGHALDFNLVYGGKTLLQLNLEFLARFLAPQPDADFDGDGDVDGADFLTWQRGVGTTSGATNAMGDANGDLAVNGSDLAIWKNQFGPASMAAASSVPEPSGASLLLAAVAVPAFSLLNCRRSRGSWRIEKSC